MKSAVLIVLTSTFLLSGCKSEVDKCVDAYMESSEVKEIIRKDSSQKSSIEAELRHSCLKAAAGK